MRPSFIISLLTAASLAAAPAAAQTGNPAAGLSVAKAVRAPGATAHRSALGGGLGGAGLYAVLIIAGIAAIVAVGVINDDDDNDSN